MHATRCSKPAFIPLAALLSTAFVGGCGAARPAEPKSGPERPAPAPAGPRARSPLLPAEQPLTPAEFVLMTDEPLFAGELGRDLFALAPGQAGFIAEMGKRAIASVQGVRTIEGPPLEEVCLANDGKTTFAVGDPSTSYEVYRGERFDGALTSLGKRLAYRYTNKQKRVWLVSNERGTFFVECESAAISRIGEPATAAEQISWNDAITAFRVTRGQAVECSVRVDDRWLTLPPCDTRGQADGSIVFETRYDPKQPRAKRRCLKTLSSDGKEIPCGSKLGQPASSTSTNVEFTAWNEARYFAPRRIAIAAKDGGVIELTRTPVPSDARRISPVGLASCNPMLPTEPLFRCRTGDGTSVVGRVERDGTWREELRRSFGNGERETFHVTVDGGVAVGGTCEGALEQAACVRRANGAFHTVRFSPELTTALARTAPLTKLVPTREGELYVGIGALEGGLGGRVSIKLFKADAGPGVAVENVPTWMLGSLANLGELMLLGGSGAFDVSETFSLGFSRADSIRIWPFARLHPAFRTREQCRVDLTLQGAFEVACEQGELRSVGRVGILQKRRGELFETLDAGGTWTKITLPSGLELTGVSCHALGCSMGPYFRRGWGTPSPH